MKESQFELLEKCLCDIQDRDEKINLKDAEIMELLDEHNLRFQKTIKHYFFLGWPGNVEGEKSRVVSRQNYNNELRSLDMFFEKLTSNHVTTEPSGQASELKENYISDILTITAERWNSIHKEREKLRTERAEWVEKELELYESFQKLISKKDQTEPALWHHQADAIPDQHLIMIVSQEKLITAEEDLLNEMESIIHLREKILTLASKF